MPSAQLPVFFSMHRLADNRSSIPQHLTAVQQRIQNAESQYQRGIGSVLLLAVSKTQGSDAIRIAANCGQRHFGENYLQEALDKQAELRDLDLCWHFIGPIQSNKTRAIAENFDWVHSVDRVKLIQRLASQRPEQLPPLNICLQINISGEDSKSGASVEDIPALVDAAGASERLRLRGLMAIPAKTEDPAQQQQAFAELTRLLTTLPDTADTLSMGMSGDMEAAIAEGSTMVRIGSDIFGPRQNR